MRASVSVLAIALIGIVGMTAITGARESERDVRPRRAPLSIGIYDHARVHPEQLDRAREAVGRLFTAIDVRIDWAGPYYPSDLRSDSRLKAPIQAPDLAVLILSAKMTQALETREDSLGCATGTGLARGHIAYVFHDRLAHVAWPGDELVNLLSLVIAHEIGHLLLPYGSHSDTGVMRSDWSVADLRRIDVARLGFTPPQVAAIRRRLSGDDGGGRSAEALSVDRGAEDEQPDPIGVGQP